MPSRPQIVIVGGGFGGLYCAQGLKDAPVEVVLVDRRNFHLFQPLLYQVATGFLSPGDVSSPLRSVLAGQKNARVVLGEAVDIDPDSKTLILKEGRQSYDILILAPGSSHHYFGHDSWAARAPGLKTVEDALEMRRRIFLAFEDAERETDAERRKTLMTFLLVGAGPTGVELAGTLAELAHHTLVNDFRNIRPQDARILLIEGTDRILPAYTPDLSEKAKRKLENLGVEVLLKTMVTEIQDDRIAVRRDGTVETLNAATVLWAAGVQASSLGRILAAKTGAPLDPGGRVLVRPDFTVPGRDDLYVIGDLAATIQDGKSLPGVAPVAMQEGAWVAEAIGRRLKGWPESPFRYRDKGSLAVIGRNAAVAMIGRLRVNGFFAWLLWVFVHIRYLIGFDNKVVVLFEWAWNYVTRKRGSRLITGKDG